MDKDALLNPKRIKMKQFKYIALILAFWVFYNCVVNSSLHICNICKTHEGSFLDCVCDHHKHNNPHVHEEASCHSERGNTIAPNSGQCSEFYYSHPFPFQPLNSNIFPLLFSFTYLAVIDLKKIVIPSFHTCYFFPYKPQPIIYNSILLI